MKLLRSFSLLVLAAAFWATPASAQTLFGGGSAYMSSSQPEMATQPALAGTQQAIQAGMRLRYNDFFRLELAGTYGTLATLESALQFFPLQDKNRLSPYAVTGFGKYIAGDYGSLRSVVPIGIGLQYRLNDKIAINTQVAGRWTLDKPENETSSMIRSIAPSVTVSYDLSKFQIADLFRRNSPGGMHRDEATGQGGLRAESGRTPTGEGLRAPSKEGITAEGGMTGPSKEGITAEGGMTGPSYQGSGASQLPGAANEAPGYDDYAPQGGYVGQQAGAGSAHMPGASDQHVATETDYAQSRVAASAPSYDAYDPQGSGVYSGGAAPSDVPVQTASYDGSGYQGADFGGMTPPEKNPAMRNAELLPDGTFIMGLTDEDPLAQQTAGRKRVTVSAFYMDRFEVSNADYRWFLQQIDASLVDSMQADSTVWNQAGNRSTWDEYYRGDKFADHPVIGVTYDQAIAYCEFQGKRLPTEAEWEYSARAALVGGIYPWPGFEPRDMQGRYLANFDPGRGGYAADGYAFTAPVMAYPPNRWGLYNMSGNVAEWVADTYSPTYSELSDFNPLFQDPEENRRIVRGGSWASDAFFIGVGVRDTQPRDVASPQIGFRCAMDVSKDGQGGAQQVAIPQEEEEGR